MPNHEHLTEQIDPQMQIELCDHAIDLATTRVLANPSVTSETACEFVGDYVFYSLKKAVAEKLLIERQPKTDSEAMHKKRLEIISLKYLLDDVSDGDFVWARGYLNDTRLAIAKKSATRREVRGFMPVIEAIPKTADDPGRIKYISRSDPSEDFVLIASYKEKKQAA